MASSTTLSFLPTACSTSFTGAPSVRRSAGSRSSCSPVCRIDLTRASLSTSANESSSPTDVSRKTQTFQRDYCKGWTDANGLPAPRLTTEMETLAALIEDRREMHHIVALQRDNWSRLLHSAISITSVSAALASALNGAEYASGLQAVSIILGLGAATLMALVSKFQPSQLAEEQRHASRFFKRQVATIESTMEVDPRLRQDASCFWKRQVGTLQALDRAFPLPLTPVVLAKFPKQIRPSKLSGDLMDVPQGESDPESVGFPHRWTPSMVNELQQTSQLLRAHDIPQHLEMARSANSINFMLAVTAPLLATAGAALNAAGCPSAAAAVTVGSLFCHTLSHGLQIGALYETSRNCAGYYEDVAQSIDDALRLPMERREDAEIFSQKVSLQLGRTPPSALVSEDEKVGNLF